MTDEEKIKSVPKPRSTDRPKIKHEHKTFERHDRGVHYGSHISHFHIKPINLP